MINKSLSHLLSLSLLATALLSVPQASACVGEIAVPSCCALQMRSSANRQALPPATLDSFV